MAASGVSIPGSGCSAISRLISSSGALVHLHRPGARRNRLRQKPIPPRARIADALRNSGEPGFNRRARRIRQHQRQIKFAGAQFPAGGKHIFVRRKRNRFVDSGMTSPQSRNFSGVSSARCAWGNFSRRRSSAGVVITASPSQLVPRTRIAARIEDGRWRIGCSWGGCFHVLSLHSPPSPWFPLPSSGGGPRTSWPGRGGRRLQRRGSRHAMMAAMDRGRPFSSVGISSPTSIRHRARPTR